MENKNSQVVTMSLGELFSFIDTFISNFDLEDPYKAKVVFTSSDGRVEIEVFGGGFKPKSFD